MRGLTLSYRDRPIEQLLCLGAHCDDIEIGCSATVLTLLAQYPDLNVTWVVMAGDERRAQEGLESAHALLAGIPKKTVLVQSFRDGFLPYQGAAVKEYFEGLKADVSPDLVLTHWRQDLHQDHRLVSELTWNTFRDHLIWEYEIPKYDGDLGNPNLFVPVDAAICRRKVENLLTTFATQADKPWFREDLFLALMRLRGMECHAPSGYAEAFYCRKAVMW
jgi:LmbE family N-acetylglucosaminyl deacetylase